MVPMGGEGSVSQVTLQEPRWTGDIVTCTLSLYVGGHPGVTVPSWG